MTIFPNNNIIKVTQNWVRREMNFPSDWWVILSDTIWLNAPNNWTIRGRCVIVIL